MSSFKNLKNTRKYEIGDIVSGDFAPSNDWLLLDGSVLNQSTYPILFSKIGLLPNLDYPDYKENVIISDLPFKTTNPYRDELLFDGTYFFAYDDVWLSGLQSVYRSTNGINWALLGSISGTSQFVNKNLWNYGQNCYVAQEPGTNTAYLSRSTNAINWTNVLSYNSTVMTSSRVFYTNSRFFMNTYSDGTQVTMYNSTNGINWASAALQAPSQLIRFPNLQGVAYFNGTYHFIHDKSEYFTSTNLVNYSPITLSGYNFGFDTETDIRGNISPEFNGKRMFGYVTSTNGVNFLSNEFSSYNSFFWKDAVHDKDSNIVVWPTGYCYLNDIDNGYRRIRTTLPPFKQCGFNRLVDVGYYLNLYPYNTSTEFILPNLLASLNVKYYIKAK